MHLNAALELAAPLERGMVNPEADRAKRSTARRTLRLRTLTSTPSFGSAQVVIRDISAAGLLIEAASGVLSKDDNLKISLPEKGEVDARVVWQSGRFSGCQFSDHLPANVISAALLKGETARAWQETAPIPESEQSGTTRQFEPELNFRAALMLSLLIWMIIGAAAVAVGG